MGFDHCEQLRLGTARPASMPRLTVREREVLGRIAEGQSTRQIARDLAIASSTARTHANNVLVKLGARSRAQAVATASPLPRARPREPDPLAALTRRERDVLACMVEGMAQAEMAERLCLSRHTVRTHVRNILGKLGAHSTLEVAALVRRLEEPVTHNFSGHRLREHHAGDRQINGHRHWLNEHLPGERRSTAMTG